MKRVVIVVVAVAIALVGAIAWKIKAQNEALSGPPGGSGVIESEGVDLSARISARVARVLVREGELVESGAVVMELECDEPEARLAEAEARLAVARTQADAAASQAEAARRQSEAARASVGAARAQVGALSTQVAVAEREADRVDAMGEHAALSRRDQARSAADGVSAQARAARATEAASARQAAASTAQAEAAAQQAQAAAQSVTAVEALVRTARIAVAECAVRAPRAGHVERIYYDVGELVLPGAAVARVIDAAEVRATFYLSNGDIDEARVGAEARVEVDAYPGRSFVGTVERVGLEAEFTPRNVQTRSDRDRLVYPVEVRVRDEARMLRPGMPVTVTLTSGRS
jgi:HlyD family secretion protein